ncbi:hypothetical protein MTO98_30435 [Mucilaginibacter sp. SMC90]|uniref:hypothetical protein n=1 Tax=Mucilaginibacter sp. SMC90 TaxID=2929803 RepID=UPI001FB3703F|nr:hypothetical protein [Mucilaginibacter sp. SMC90]UOE48720.1 hypothetical protein MTO98_30435 [Mucilaginibacter sp. SMC90]
MAILNNPVSVAVVRENGSLEIFDLIPVYEEEAHAFVATDVLRIYEGFPRAGEDGSAEQSNRDRYLQYIDSPEIHHDFFLGELRLNRDRIPDWKYQGNKLTSNEIWQLVTALKVLTDEHIEEEAAIAAILNEEANSTKSMAFIYGEDFQADTVRIQEMKGHFIILINEQIVAKLEMTGGHWEVTGGSIDDPFLLSEIISHINAAAT